MISNAAHWVAHKESNNKQHSAPLRCQLWNHCAYTNTYDINYPSYEHLEAIYVI